MPIIRPTAFRTPLVSRFSRPATSFRNAGFGRRIASRGYATGHGEHKKAGSDLPWLISAVVVTVPSCYYLMQPRNTDHLALGPSHALEHDKSATPAEKLRHVKASSGKDEEPQDEEEKPEEQKQEEESAGESQSEEELQPTPEGKGSVEGVSFKGPTNQAPDHKMPDTRTSEDTGSMGKTKYIKSGLGQPQGAKGDVNEEGEDATASAKEAGSQNVTSGKQDGLSNAPTKHPQDLMSDPNKAKKGEGIPESAKSQGPVDPDRPPAENKEKRGQDKL